MQRLALFALALCFVNCNSPSAGGQLTIVVDGVDGLPELSPAEVPWDEDDSERSPDPYVVLSGCNWSCTTPVASNTTSTRWSYECIGLAEALDLDQAAQLMLVWQAFDADDDGIDDMLSFGTGSLDPSSEGAVLATTNSLGEVTELTVTIERR